MKKSKIISYLIFLFSIFIILTGCQLAAQNPERSLAKIPYEETEFLMGTIVRVAVYDQDKEEALSLAFDRIEELAAFITSKENSKHSMIKKINDSAGQAPVVVSPDLYTLIKSAVSYSEQTDGSFDLTIGPITDLWHIGYPDARKPEQAEIDKALSLVDYSQLELNDKEQSVYLPKEGMRIDLGAIAKGFITDETVKVLKEHQVTTAIIDLGGNIFVMGSSPKEGAKEWKVGIQDPFEERGTILGSIAVSNQSIVTSGIYERFLKVDGKQYPHLMDPETGYPFDNELAGVSVVTEESIDGDALSTSLFSKGLEEGLAYVNRLDNVDALFITKDKKVYLSEGLKEFSLTNNDFELMDGE